MKAIEASFVVWMTVLTTVFSIKGFTILGCFFGILATWSLLCLIGDFEK